MSFICSDLDKMILERAKGEDLSEIARVSKPLRSFIAENPHRMRPIVCSRLSICACDENPKNLYIRVLIKHREKEIIQLIRAIYKYKPKTTLVLSADADSAKDRNAIEATLNSIPDWWTDRIGKITVDVRSTLFYGLTSKLRHISEMKINDENEDLVPYTYTEDVIINSQQVDKFNFTLCDSDDLLDAVIIKSQIYPTTIPVFGNRVILLKSLILFMEGTKFSDCSPHTGKACLQGSREDWATWLRENTTPIGQSLAPSDNLLRRRPVKHNFRYREWKFSITISFII